VQLTRSDTVATKYTVISSDGTTVLSPSNRDRELSFDAPGVDAGQESVLLCVVRPTIETDPTVRLEMKVNTRPIPVLGVSFRDDGDRSLHAVVNSAHLREDDNKLTMTFEGDAGSIRVSEVVLLYK
jgi:hypothetical protein